MPSFNDICSGKEQWRGPNYGAPPPWSRTRIFVGPYDCPPDTVCKQPEYPCAFNGTDGKTVQELRKIDVLKYTSNSLSLTKQQKYSRMIQGVGPNGKYTWATQTRFYSNPNSFNYQRKGPFILFCKNSMYDKQYPNMCYTADTCLANN